MRHNPLATQIVHTILHPLQGCCLYFQYNFFYGKFRRRLNQKVHVVLRASNCMNRYLIVIANALHVSPQAIFNFMGDSLLTALRAKHHMKKHLMA
jgi:hypothetical protein